MSSSILNKGRNAFFYASALEVLVVNKLFDRVEVILKEMKERGVFVSAKNLKFILAAGKEAEQQLIPLPLITDLNCLIRNEL